MRYLGLGLFAEGPTDHRFFAELLWRVVNDICLRLASEQIEVGEIISLHPPGREQQRTERILEATREVASALDLLFIHCDGGGDPTKVEDTQIEPARTLITHRLAWQREQVISVLPVREMEAWTLVDGTALRTAFHTKISDADMGLPTRAREVEAIFDPKQVLESAFRAAIGKPKRHQKAADFFPQIGQAVSLELLRNLPSYCHLEERLSIAVKALNMIT